MTDRHFGRSTAPLALWVVALSGVLLWPQRLAGYGLGRDMVFTPQQPLTAATLGASSAAPRAVPVDALVALVERVVDGAVVGRIGLLVPLVAAGLGVVALLDAASPAAPQRVGLAGRWAAATFAVWNPFVVERLALGQWALLWAYGSLPWVVRAALRVRAGVRTPLHLVLPVAAASITPTGGLLATGVGIATAGLRGRRALWSACCCVLLQAPWLVAAAVSTARSVSDRDAVAAFATRGEAPGGPLVAALTGGGLWNSATVPSSRTGVLGLVSLAVLAAAAVAGWSPLASVLGRGARNRLAVCAAVGFALAVAASVPGLRTVVITAAGHLPGGGLLRDGQKWLAALVGFEALVLGVAVDRLARRLTGAWRPTLVVAALAVPLVLLPDGAATAWPTLRPVHYPSGWTTVRAEARDGDVTVLPFQAYRALPWTDRRPVLDPAPRLLAGTTVVDDSLVVSGRVVPGEDARAAEVGAALRAGPGLVAGLRAAGIRWVLLERGTPGTVPNLAALTLRWRDADLALYRVPGRVVSERPSGRRIAAGVTALSGWCLLVLASLTVSVRGAVKRLLQSRAMTTTTRRTS